MMSLSADVLPLISHPEVRLGSTADVGGSGAQRLLLSGFRTSKALARESIAPRTALERKADAEAHSLQCLLVAASASTGHRLWAKYFVTIG